MSVENPYNGPAIYKIINIINGKFYLGSSAYLQIRWNAHKSHLKNNKHHAKYLQRSWNKYGADNFDFIILEKCDLNKETLLKREQYYLDTLNPIFNNCKTAGSTLGIKMPLEFGEAITKRQTGRPSTLKGVKKSKDFGEKISSVTKGEKNPFFGKTHTTESKGIIKEKRKNQIMKNNKKVIQYIINSGVIKTFNSITEAAKENNLKTCSNISESCKGKKIIASSLWFYEDEFTDNELQKRLNKYKNKIKKVIQIDPNNLVQIKIWSSAKEAALSLNTFESCIRRSCKTKLKAVGYLWSYL